MEKPLVRSRLRRTKAQIKLLLIEAVGEIVRTRGYESLSAANIARQATVGKQTISLYFGMREKLIEEYMQQENTDLAFEQKPKK